ncbi:MAG: type III secretion inner membrane ring lipoprotein SctJ [Pseudomonadota bacterium]
MTRPLLFVLLLLLAACGRGELYSDLSEAHANEMLVVLDQSGIHGSKTETGEGRFAISVAGDDFADAIAALNAQGFPRDDFATLGDVFAKEGFVSSQLSERARLMYGLSQEMSRTLTSLDGVVVARVHLAIPQHDPLSDAPKPSSASVFIKHRAGTDLSGDVGQIKALVVNGVEGLAYDNVTVAMFPAKPYSRPERRSGGGLAMGLGILAIIAGGLGVASLWPAIRRRLSPRAEPAE